MRAIQAALQLALAQYKITSPNLRTENVGKNKLSPQTEISLRASSAAATTHPAIHHSAEKKRSCGLKKKKKNHALTKRVSFANLLLGGCKRAVGRLETQQSPPFEPVGLSVSEASPPEDANISGSRASHVRPIPGPSLMASARKRRPCTLDMQRKLSYLREDAM